jgi:hypothetical protein
LPSPRPHPRLALAALAFALLGAPAREARAEAPKKRTSTLGWDRLPGADGCIATQALARAVEARLGRKVFVSPAEADVSVEGRAEKKGQGFAATIVLRDSEGKVLGTRSLEKAGASCDALTESLVLVVAVMIDPDAALAPAPPPPPPPPAEKPSAPPPEVRVETVYVPVPVPMPEKPKKPVPPALLFDAAFGARFTAGTVPGVGLGVSAVGVLVPRGFIGLQGRASYVVPSAASVLSAEVAFSHGTLAGGLCPLAHVFGRALLTACAEGEVGLLFARPSGLPRSVNEMRATLSGGLGFGASVKVVGPLTLRANVAGYIPFLRESFEVTLPDGTRQEVFRQLPVTFGGDVGIGLRIP